MKLKVEIEEGYLRSLIETIVREEIQTYFRSTEGKKEIRSGAIEYLTRYSLFEFMHLLEEEKR